VLPLSSSWASLLLRNGVQSKTLKAALKTVVWENVYYNTLRLRFAARAEHGFEIWELGNASRRDLQIADTGKSSFR
jgi:hypothetical protein